MSSSPIKTILLSLIVALGFTTRGNSATSPEALHPISDALQRLLLTRDGSEASEAIKDYSIVELATLPDSVLFDYYYLKAFIKGEEGKEKQKRNYLIAAKELCEKSLGIHSPVYLELCWAIGDSYKVDGDLLSAFEIYQAALIQSIGLYTLDDEDVEWQYNDIETKVKEWYQDEELRRSMVNHREHLPPRDAGKDALQNDMEFYFHMSKDKEARDAVVVADSLMNIGNWAEATCIYLDVAQQITDNPIAKATIQELAAICRANDEDFENAERLLLDNLKMLQGHERAKAYRRALSLLSIVYISIHNYSKAKDYAGEAKYWYEKALDFSRGYILCLHRCANLERGKENYFLAMLFEDVALQELYRYQVTESISGDSIYRDAFLADILSGASLHYNQFGYREEAYSQLEKAIDIAECNNFDATTYYANLVSLALAGKEVEKALRAAHKAYEMSKSVIHKIEIGTELCMSQYFAHKPISEDVLVESSTYLQQFVYKTFAYTSMEERRNLWNGYMYHFPLLNFLAYSTGNKELNGQIYNNILLEKGLLLRTANNIRDQILSQGSLEDIHKYDNLLQLKKLLPSLTADQSKRVKDEIESLDKELTRKFSQYAHFTNSNDIFWENICERLGPEDIAIEFYNIPQVEWKEGGMDLDGKVRYCALVLRNGYREPHMIPLCTEEKLLAISPNRLYNDAELYGLIWAPLEEELKGVKNIYFASYRELHKIAIEYAQMPDESAMGDYYDIYRLSSTRVLAERIVPRKTEKVVLYGGLVYDLEAEDLISESRNGEFHSISGSRAFLDENMRAGFKYLPGTLEEVEKISQYFTGGVKMITGKPGTEESFKALAGTPINIIHLATHGFFWTDKNAQENKKISFLKIKNEETSSEDWALLRSGLIFSGANIVLKGNPLPDDVEDGVLTAFELSNMNLGNVDLVVMSACESGLGETFGEGVFGLQRGFKLAGANSLLMSLWKVDDDATQLLMTNFYRNLMSGQSKQQALLKAQKAVRENPRYNNPKYWAAFILLDALN